MGVLSYELLSGHAPFEGTDDETKVKIASINYTFPDYFSPLARRFIDNVSFNIEINTVRFYIRFFIYSFYKKILNDVCHF